MGYETICAFHSAGRKRWNGGGRHGVLIHNKCDDPRHPTVKPQPLMRELINLFTDPGEIILDPFAGSGSTLRAAKDLGRYAVGIERERRYVDVAIDNLRQGVLL